MNNDKIKKLISNLQKPYVYAIIAAIMIISINAYVLMKTYIVSSFEQYAENLEKYNYSEQKQSQQKKTEITDSSYSDGNITISIDTIREYDTEIYIGEIKIKSPEYLKTAFANNSFGTNITQKTSEIAESSNAIFAVNGDYYGANRNGFVIKNGVLYRDTVRRDSQYDDMIIYSDGSMSIVNENDISAQTLLQKGAVQTFCFGPALIENGSITVDENDEVGKAMADNPRTVIGCVDKLHYIIMVSDGRTSESKGLSLYQAAQIMKEYGCKTAYNLDGGGSSTMYFNGRIINNPTTNGRRISERAVSDIVYIGY